MTRLWQVAPLTRGQIRGGGVQVDTAIWLFQLFGGVAPPGRCRHGDPIRNDGLCCGSRPLHGACASALRRRGDAAHQLRNLSAAADRTEVRGQAEEVPKLLDQPAGEVGLSWRGRPATPDRRGVKDGGPQLEKVEGADRPVDPPLRSPSPQPPLPPPPLQLCSNRQFGREERKGHRQQTRLLRRRRRSLRWRSFGRRGGASRHWARH